MIAVLYQTPGRCVAHGLWIAQVQAVRQAAPYFAELGDYDLDFSDGSTTYTFS